MQLHKSTFEYHTPTEAQVEKMARLRVAAKDYANALMNHMPDGPDKTYALRKLREIAMWANVAITRDADGTPRE